MEAVAQRGIIMNTEKHSSDDVVFDRLNEKYIHGKALEPSEEPELRKKRTHLQEESVPDVEIPTEEIYDKPYAGTEIYEEKKPKNSYKLFAVIAALSSVGILFFGGLIFTTTFMTKSIMQTSTKIAGGYLEGIVKETATEQPVVAPVKTETAENEKSAVGTYHVKAFNPDAKGAAAMLKTDEAGLKEFDEFVSSVMEKKPHLVLRNVFLSDSPAALPQIADVHNIYKYIMSVSAAANREMTPETALIEACAIALYAREYDLSPELVVGVTQKESMFNPLAVSSKGAAGPMQVMYNIHYKLLSNIGITERDQLFTPDYGVKAGCYLLSRYMKDKKSVTGALRSYYGELNSNYVSGIMTYRHAYELFSQGIVEDPVVMSSAENVDWKRMTNKTAPVKKKTTQTTIRAAKNQPTKQGAKSSLTTVYNNTEGRIKIQRPDGSVLIQKVIE